MRKLFLTALALCSGLWAQTIIQPATIVFPKTVTLGTNPTAWQPFMHPLVGSGNSITVNATVPANTLLLIELAATQYAGLAATFNGSSCNIDGQENPSNTTWQSNDSVALLSCQVSSLTTANIVVSWTTVGNYVLQFATVATAHLQGVDQTATGCGTSGSGSCTSVTTGPTTLTSSTTTYASEVAVGICANNKATMGGNWQNSFIDSQHDNYTTALTLDEGWITLTTTQTVIATKSGTTSGQSACVLGTYRL